jgi:hypothetical protein
VKQAARATAGAESEIMLFDERGFQSTHRRIASNARTHDPAADD